MSSPPTVGTWKVIFKKRRNIDENKSGKQVIFRTNGSILFAMNRLLKNDYFERKAKEVLKMEKQKKHMQKAKTWNMVSLVFKAIGVISSITVIKKRLFPTKAQFTIAGTFMKEQYDLVNNFGAKAFFAAALIVSIAVLVMLIMNHQKLSKGIQASKVPYFLYLGWAFVGYIYSIVTAKMPEVPTGQALSSSTVNMIGYIGGFIGLLIQAAPIIITLVHVFKADTDEQNQGHIKEA